MSPRLESRSADLWAVFLSIPLPSLQPVCSIMGSIPHHLNILPKSDRNDSTDSSSGSCRQRLGGSLTSSADRSQILLGRRCHSAHARQPEPGQLGSRPAAQPTQRCGCNPNRKLSHYFLNPACCPQTQNICESEPGKTGRGWGGTEHTCRHAGQHPVFGANHRKQSFAERTDQLYPLCNTDLCEGEERESYPPRSRAGRPSERLPKRRHSRKCAGKGFMTGHTCPRNHVSLTPHRLAWLYVHALLCLSPGAHLH